MLGCGFNRRGVYYRIHTGVFCSGWVRIPICAHLGTRRIPRWGANGPGGHASKLGERPLVDAGAKALKPLGVWAASLSGVPTVPREGVRRPPGESPVSTSPEGSPEWREPIVLNSSSRNEGIRPRLPPRRGARGGQPLGRARAIKLAMRYSLGTVPPRGFCLPLPYKRARQVGIS